ncbi:hypothetical protein BJ085DRAFT_41317 [Dimargaris cristalligena]|uniref:PCI domain-containing protein n=1 Tax=Dimargaris cristalligena TaxID=215637 RepID=A0A4P9ZQP7_9FUNG|nr:hypothetical protein BJ085DRAFT_41317 [Dimargaris cristalligena]|eukprot:RKP34962.1 hypothetical protein BJ085DRAFT_41317 [Dimargaris cristalligena]
MDVDNAVAEFLEVKRKRVPATLQVHYSDFNRLYDLKLWHQLTLKVEEFTRIPEAGPYLIPLYEHFVSDWEKKVSQVKFVLIALAVARQYHDFKQALEFMDSIMAKVDTPETQDAYVLALMEAGHFQLLLGNLEGTATALEKGEKILDGFNTVDPVIHASFYRVSADFNKAKADFGQYYKNALLYLACITLDDMAVAEKVERAHDLALAALLSDKIYNFGDLLMHPILESLKGTEHAWLGDALHIFNTGSIAKYDVLSGNFAKESILQSHAAFLRQKICLMTLIEILFKRISVSRRMTFEDVAKETRLNIEEVEHLVMKALSLGLIKGHIDQVDQVINIQWVQPRYLDRNQIREMANQLAQWEDKVGTIISSMEAEAPSLFA